MAAVCFFCRRVCRKRAPGACEDSKVTVLAEKSALGFPQIAQETKPKTVELPLERIVFKEELGEGQFGEFTQWYARYKVSHSTTELYQL